MSKARTKTTTFSYATIERLLRDVGFEQVPTKGSHLAFHHAPLDVWILLPGGRPDDTLDAIHVATIRRQLVERGLVDNAAAFDALAAASLQCA